MILHPNLMNCNGTTQIQHAIKKNRDARQAYIRKPFQYSSRVVSTARQGNGQGGSMQNIVVAYFYLLTFICMTTTIVAYFRSDDLYCNNLCKTAVGKER